MIHGLLTKARDETLMAAREWHAAQIPKSKFAMLQAVGDDLTNLPIIAVKIVKCYWAGLGEEDQPVSKGPETLSYAGQRQCKKPLPQVEGRVASSSPDGGNHGSGRPSSQDRI